MCCDISLLDGYSGYTGLQWKGEKDKPWFETGILSYPKNYLGFMNVQLLQGNMPVTDNDIIADLRFSELKGTDIIGTKVFTVIPTTFQYIAKPVTPGSYLFQDLKMSI